MKHLIPSVIIAMILCAAAARAQDAIAHINLKNGERLAGVVLAVSDAKVIIQPDFEKYERGYYALRDYSVVCDNARAVPFEDIDSLYLERSSHAWLIGFPLVPIVVSFALAVIFEERSNPDAFLGGSFAGKVGFAAGLMLGSVIGGILAPIIFFSTGSDFWVDMNDPSDINALKNSALFPDNLPPALQALE